MLVDAAGLHVHIHTIGDRAVRDALDAIERAAAVNPAWDRRPTLAHIQVVHPADIPRFASLGVVANGQPYWARRGSPDGRPDHARPGRAERSAWQYPFASLLRSGARLAFGSDWSVSTADPLQEIEVAVRRVSPDHRDAEPFLPDERISLEAAVHAFTLGSAYVNGLEAETGSITVGKLADLIVLDRDLFAPDVLPGDARVLLTMVEGEAVVEDPALEGLTPQATRSRVMSATVGTAEQGHGRGRLGAQDLDGAGDAGLTGRRQGIQEGPADEDGAGAKGERRDDVRAAPHAAVEIDLCPSLDRLDDRLEGIDGRRHAVELASAVVGDDDRGRPVLDGQPRVVGREETLDHQRQRGQRAQPVDVRPGQRGIQLVAHEGRVGRGAADVARRCRAVRYRAAVAAARARGSPAAAGRR